LKSNLGLVDGHLDKKKKRSGKLASDPTAAMQKKMKREFSSTHSMIVS
jgi:hypothetical protein